MKWLFLDRSWLGCRRRGIRGICCLIVFENLRKPRIGLGSRRKLANDGLERLQLNTQRSALLQHCQLGARRVAVDFTIPQQQIQIPYRAHG